MIPIKDSNNELIVRIGRERKVVVGLQLAQIAGGTAGGSRNCYF